MVVIVGMSSLKASPLDIILLGMSPLGTSPLSIILLRTSPLRASPLDIIFLGTFSFPGNIPVGSIPAWHHSLGNVPIESIPTRHHFPESVPNGSILVFDGYLRHVLSGSISALYGFLGISLMGTSLIYFNLFQFQFSTPLVDIVSLIIILPQTSFDFAPQPDWGALDSIGYLGHIASCLRSFGLVVC